MRQAKDLTTLSDAVPLELRSRGAVFELRLDESSKLSLTPPCANIPAGQLRHRVMTGTGTARTRQIRFPLR